MADHDPARDNLQAEFTPTEALELGLDFDYLVNNLDSDHDPDHIDWDSYLRSSVDHDENAPEASDILDGFDDGDPEGDSLERAFDALAAEPENNCLPGFPCNLNDEAPAEQPLDRTLAVSAMQWENRSSPGSPNHSTHWKPLDKSLDTILFEISDFPGHDLNSQANFELPDNPSGLDFLQGLQLVGRDTQPAMSPDVGHTTPQLRHPTGSSTIQGYASRRVAWDETSSTSRVAVVGSSEPNPENESRAVLTNLRRLSKVYRGGANQKQPDRSRVQTNKAYVENTAYTPLEQAPEKWDIFEYTRDGELDPSRLFSAEEINRLLFNHPLHRGHRNLKESQLRLRVHKTPAASAKRFPNGLKCRFEDCPMRTINQGQLLIVVDELSMQHPDHDYYLNAAYVHLWCIERFCNFPEICAQLNVSAKGCDPRKESGRRNRFRLTTSEEEMVVRDYVEACANGRLGGNPWVARCPDQQTNGCPHYEQQSLPYRGTLCHQLTVTKLHYGGRGRINLRKHREDRAGYEGANITRHVGDLSREFELREYSRSHRNQNQLKPNPKTGRYYREIEEEEQPGYSHSVSSRPQTHQPLSPNQYGDEPDNGQTLDQDTVEAANEPRHPGLQLTIPQWDLDQSNAVESGSEGFQYMMDLDNDYHDQDVCKAVTPISPRTTLPPKSWRKGSQLQTTATGPPQEGCPTSIDGLSWTISEDESEAEIELEMLAAQRRRRALEIEDAKDKEEECRLRKLKLQKANGKRRARGEGGDDGDRSDSRGKRQRT